MAATTERLPDGRPRAENGPNGISARVGRYLNGLPGCWAVKYPGTAYRRNVPDWLVCLGGLFLAVEVKVPGHDATPAQASEMAKIRRAKGLTFVVHSVDEMRALVEPILAELGAGAD